MDAFDKEIDSNIDFALWLAARELKSVWLPLLEEGKLEIRDVTKRYNLSKSFRGARGFEAFS